MAQLVSLRRGRPPFLLVVAVLVNSRVCLPAPRAVVPSPRASPRDRSGKGRGGGLAGRPRALSKVNMHVAGPSFYPLL